MVAELLGYIADIHYKRFVVFLRQTAGSLQREIIACAAENSIVVRHIDGRFDERVELAFSGSEQFVVDIVQEAVSGLVISCVKPPSEWCGEGFAALLAVTEYIALVSFVGQMPAETDDARCIGRRGDAIC